MKKRSQRKSVERESVGSVPREPHAPTLRTLQRSTVVIGLALAASSSLLACFGPIYESVHFNSERPDFLRMPQPWLGTPSEKRALPVWRPGDESAYNAPTPSTRAAQEAMRLEGRLQFRQAVAAWERYRKLAPLDAVAAWYELPVLPQTHGLDDRLRALRAWRGPRGSAFTQRS